MSKSIPKIGDFFDDSFDGMETNAIKSVLGGIAYDVLDEKYTRQLSDDELTEKRELFADLSIDVAAIQEEIKDFTDLRKIDIKAKSKEMGTIIGDIKTRTTTVTGTTFAIDDQENGLMIIYDEQGKCIDVRALKAKEKQKKIFSITDKTGTHGE